MLIFFDIDGTLLGEWSHLMPESAAKAIAAARHNGHVCAVNTGRTRKMVEPDLEKLKGFDALLMGCGTMVTLHDRVLFHRTFAEKEAEEIMEALYRYGIDAVLEGSGNNFHDRIDNIRTKTFRDFVKRFAGEGYGSFREAAGRFDKFFSYVDDVAVMMEFQKEFEGRLDFVDRKGGFFEIMPKGCSKASAMEFLADELGISMKDTAALGDSSNDIPMLRRAYIAIAMGNATEDVKAEADYVTTSLEEDGVWNALKWLGVI